jgi:hypothetical protein
MAVRLRPSNEDTIPIQSPEEAFAKVHDAP